MGLVAGECLQGWAAKLLLVRWLSWYCTEFLHLTGVCLITIQDFQFKPDLSSSFPQIG